MFWRRAKLLTRFVLLVAVAGVAAAQVNDWSLTSSMPCAGGSRAACSHAADAAPAAVAQSHSRRMHRSQPGLQVQWRSLVHRRPVGNQKGSPSSRPAKRRRQSVKKRPSRKRPTPRSRGTTLAAAAAAAAKRRLPPPPPRRRPPPPPPALQARRPPPTLHPPQALTGDWLKTHAGLPQPPYGNVPATVDELPIELDGLPVPPPAVPPYGEVPVTVDELPIVLDAQTPPL